MGKGGIYDPETWHEQGLLPHWMEFLEAIFHKKDFASRWIGLITMTCIQSVTYSILVNGQLSGTIILTWGIRQGDPLSPYLFLLCVKTLSSLPYQAERSGYISGVSTSKHGP